MRKIRRTFAKLLASAAFFVSGCVVLERPPGPTTYDDRLSMLPTDDLPVEQTVTVRWDKHQIPFIEAQTDGDAAFALGLVHAHLRLGQMAILRRIGQGRIAESAGPLAADIDTALKTFDFGRASDEIYAALPPDSRLWVDRFVAGVNHYAGTLEPHQMPHEMKFLDIEWEPWTAADSILLGRLGGIDINWGTLATLLGIEDRALRTRLLARLQKATAEGRTTYLDGAAGASASLQGLELLAGLGSLVGKSGSNSFVIAPDRSESGAALIANDPHLGFLIPNLWLVAGLRSPSYTFAGMMAVGTPVFGFGRNPHLSWGGTNLRATTSQLVDVSALPADAIHETALPLGQRFWFDTEAKARMSPYGPVVSGLTVFPKSGRDLAVRWVGHTVSDEVTALLAAMRAERFADFRDAMQTFALPSQVFLVADTDGTIASMMATKIPARPANEPLPLTVTPEQADRNWREYHWGPDLPLVVNPETGFLASANNRPTADESKPYGGFFPQDERIRRLHERLEAQSRWTLDDVKAVQQDTVSPLSRQVVQYLEPRLNAAARARPDVRQAVALLLGWDGDYAIDSKAAPVFEALLTRLAPAVYAQLGRQQEFEYIKSMSFIRNFLIEDMALLSEAQWAAALNPALDGAAAMAASGRAWGDIHTIRVRHVLGNVPVLGGRYELGEIAVPGSRETILKTAHNLTDEPHNAFFGAQSRHVSDMSDPDENYFVLFGGQDGWIGSPNFADQVPLWQRGEYVRIPLTAPAVEKAFPRVTVLAPAG